MIVSNLPYAVIDEISINLTGVLLIYLCLLLLILFLKNRELIYYKIMVISVLFFCAFKVNNEYNSKITREIIFYSINDNTAIGLRQGNEISLWGDTSLLANHDKIQFNLKGHWVEENIKDIEMENMNALKKHNGNRVLVWNKKTILFYEKPFLFKNEEKIDIDYLVFKNSPWVDVEALLNNYNVKYYIIDGTNDYKTRNYISQHFEKVYDLNEKGVLRIEIRT